MQVQKTGARQGYKTQQQELTRSKRKKAGTTQPRDMRPVLPQQDNKLTGTKATTTIVAANASLAPSVNQVPVPYDKRVFLQPCKPNTFLISTCKIVIPFILVFI